jgi:putative transposase
VLIDLGVARSHSRPHVSNDNPYSEAAFKTLKYYPEFPDRFGSIEDARAFCIEFFEHYNHVHRHSGIGLHTPASVHYGTAARRPRSENSAKPLCRLHSAPTRSASGIVRRWHR